MRLRDFKRYLSIFVLAVLIIAVYKTFDNVGIIFGMIGSFFSLLSPIIVAFVIAFLLFPLCSKTEKYIKRKLPQFFAKRARGISVLSVYVFAILVISGLFYLLLPTLVKSIVEFMKMVPHIVQDIVNKLNESKYIKIDLSNIDKYIDFQKFLQDSKLLNFDTYTTKIISVSSVLIKLILSLITSIYILIDRDSLKSFARTSIDLFVKKKKKNFIMNYVRQGIDFAYKYVFCAITDAVIIFIISLVILSIMRVKYAPVLALMLGLFNLIPYFGAISACIISVLITFMTSDPSTAIILAIILLALQQIDANVIQPNLIKGRLSVRPFWVLVGIFVGGGLFGIVGILLAIPVLALMRTILNDYFDYRRKKLDEKETTTKQ